MAQGAGEAQDEAKPEGAREEADPLLGVTLDGRFRIASLIGKGGMGRVYRAVQVPLNRPVALKVLDSNYGAGREEAFRQRFLVEAALTARLSHPNTVRIYDYGCTQDGIFFLAMEYLDGSTLDRVLTKGPLPWRKALSITQQVARALREAHELGVVHRDLKPANIMLLAADDDTEFAKVLDFGLVKSFIEGQELEGRAITQQGMLMGSPVYMAPEQGERNRADPRCDIYALGVMLFEMVTGQPPFNGRQEMEIILKHVHDPVPPVTTPPGYDAVPEVLQETIKRCLAKSPMDRFQTMDELLQALHELARPSATPVPAPPRPAPETSQPLPAPLVKPWILFTGFGLAMLVGVGITALVLRRPVRQVDPPHVVTPPPPGPAVKAQVTFHVETEPPGALVQHQGKMVGVTPMDLPVAADPSGTTTVELILRKEGFQSLSVSAGGSGPRILLSQKLQALGPEHPQHTAPPQKRDSQGPGPTTSPTPGTGGGTGTTVPTTRPASRLDEEEDEPKDELKRPIHP